MQGLFHRAAASIVALVLLAPQTGGVSVASSPSRSALRAPYVALASPPQRIPVKEPVRVKPAKPKLDATPAKPVQAIRAHGVRVEGPRMLLPMEIDRPIASARRRALQRTPATTAVPARPSQPGRSIPQRPSTGSPSGPPGTRRAMSLPSDPNASGTGINPWWRYQEENVPGGGHVMVNVGTGNLLLQDDDMSVPHKGIAMAFHRTYNSQNAAATLVTAWGNFQSLYGNGWTNTFDARFISQSATLKSIYDIDGARYDYSYDSSTGIMTSLTPGQHASLVFDGNCGWLWTKKSGTTYYFYTMNPNAVVGCPSISTIGGYSGRLHQIIGRNRNTSITFNYSWDNGDASINGKISQITATTESGMTTTLSFADASGRRLLQQLTFPDGSTNVQYGYDPSGNLIWVSRPPNNAAGTRPAQTFGYQAVGSDSVMQYAASPRWCQGSTSGCGYDGGYLYFAYTGNTAATSTLNLIMHGATVNPSIPDGTNTSLHPGYVPDALNYSNYLFEYYTTGVATPTFRDTDGHMTNWVVDGLGRATQTQECTASLQQGQQCVDNLHWLTTNESWDANNNLSSETDPRGNETDYAYDIHGNTVAVAAPPPTPGAFRPTQLLTYDANDNVTAYCDPNATHSTSADWTSVPTAPSPGQGGLCPQSTIATQYHWSTSTADPFGELTAATTPATAAAPLGYQRAFSYDVGPQGGTDYGLPTRVAGTAITQSGDPTTPTRQPLQTFWYDANGNLVCYGTGTGQWLLAYDSLGRLTTTADPDDSASGSGPCGKTGAQPGWNTTSRTSYFADGSVASKQTASQVVNGISTSFTYDVDGNPISETHHHGCTSVASCTAGVTSKWYDGAGRLVEVQQPYDANDIQAYPWSTRYIYDISGGHTTNYRGMGLVGYGNLVSTQELLSGTVWEPGFGQTYPISSGTWTDVRATSFDALDRAVSNYEAALGDQPKVTNTYDGPGATGLLSSVRLATNEVKSFVYDGLGRRTDVTYTNDGGVTPAIHEAFDAAGHVTSRTTAVLGTETLSYDATGATTSVFEPASIGGGTIQFGYYADGMRASAGYSDSIQSYPNAMRYGYRADGERDH
ncbi:MAG TPA: DUF6531 domain-containing protein [Candidatus Elarobacter sp.]|jgi:YD repeat-containing protein|nr:DUF6531 domain-containing protein [Candidatus Elarobacter sp.]